MLKSINCIQTGQILINESLNSFILCNNCHKEYLSLHNFHQHLKQCNGYDKLFKSNLHINYNNNGNYRQLLGKTQQITKEYLIYDFRDIKVMLKKSAPIREKNSNLGVLNNIDEELLDPRWYTDGNNYDTNNSNTKAIEPNTIPKTVIRIVRPTTKDQPVKPDVKRNIQYDKLVKAVTPYVQFKENVKTVGKFQNVVILNRKKLTELETSPGPPLPSLQNQTNGVITGKNESSPKFAVKVNSVIIPKSITEVDKQRVQSQNNAVTVEYEDISELPIKRQKTNNGQKVIASTYLPNVNENRNEKKFFQSRVAIENPPQILPVSVPSSLPSTLPLPPATEKQTAQILNKLQTLGLQIKRTQTSVMANNKSGNETLELLQKLQSKGMKIKIVKQKSTTSDSAPLVSNTSLQAKDILRTHCLDIVGRRSLLVSFLNK